MNFKRIISLGLAVLMTVSPMTIAVEAVAPPAADKTLTLTFGDGSQSGTVIRGSSVQVKAENTANYQIKAGADALKIVDAMNHDANSEFNLVLEKQTTNSQQFRVTSIKPNPAVYPVTKNYTVKSNYNSLQSAATALCIAESASGTLETIGSKMAIIRNSEGKLTFKDGKFTFAPSTEIDADGSSAAGLFKGWSNTVTIQNFVIGDKETSPTWYKLDFTNEQKQPVHFTFYPNQRHEIIGDHDNNPLTPDKPTGKYTYEIKDGSVYDIRFTNEGSNIMMLTVKNPLDALQEVAQRATEPSQTFPSDFFKGTGAGDDFRRITQSFDIRGIYETYGEKVDLTWRWIPNDINDQNVVRISGTTDWQRVVVTPDETDVEGKMEVTVSYRNKALFSPVGDVEMAKTRGTVDILIHGSGIAANVSQLSQVIGKNPEVAFAPNDKAIPSKKTMDCYKGEVAGFKDPIYPHIYSLGISFGSGNGCAKQLVITSTNPEVVTATLGQGNTMTNYKFGSTYINADPSIDNPTDGKAVLVANKPGVTTITFAFYIVGGDKKPVEDIRARRTFTLEVTDTSPSTDSTLKTLVVEDSDKNGVDFGFDPKTSKYGMDLEYHIKSITLRPTKNDGAANSNIKMTVLKKDANGIFKPENPTEPDVISGRNSRVINLVPNEVTRIELIVTAENPMIETKYTLEIMRAMPSTNAKLATLTLEDGEGIKYDLKFKPETNDYTVDVPYYVSKVKPIFTTQDKWATAAVTSPALVTLGIPFGMAEWVAVPYDGVNTSVDIKIKTKSQNDIALETATPPKPIEDSKTYTIKVNRGAPAKESSVMAVELTDGDGKKLTTKPAKFDPVTDIYDVALTYAQSKVKFKVNTTDKRATLYLADSKDTKIMDIKSGAVSKAVDINYTTTMVPTHDIKVVCVAEDGKTKTSYGFQFTREPPNDDATLKSVDFAADDGSKPLLSFSPYQFDYSMEVPYTVKEMTVTPTANNAAVSLISVNDRKTDNAQKSLPIKISDGDTIITIKVTAQDTKVTNTYTFKVTRSKPSSDARLKSLAITNAAAVKPVFVASTLKYSTTVNDKANAVTVNAVPNDKNARVIINGIPVKNGAASEPIVPIEVKSKITIEVIAQDNSSTNIYTIDLTNPNMIEKTNNADLYKLEVDYGAIAPKFKPSITTYNVAVDEETFAVDILPVPADPLAEMKVFKGTKEMGDRNGNYSEAISDGLTQFTVEVTSPDKTLVKSYDINVYKKDEENQGTLKPTMPADINFTVNPVVVDVTRYSRVDKSVFEEMKKYPEKNIIFIGNDYSLEFKASELKTVIPSTQVYDFGMTFTTPYLDDIEELLFDHISNEDISKVMLDFKQHTALPGPAKLTVSLGKHYRNDTLFWHDYNVERNRIDYYSKVESNTKGNIALIVDKIGTSIIGDRKILGSENKDGEYQPVPPVTDTGKKPNPNTGVKTK